VKYRAGDVSPKTAARVLHIGYATVIRLLRTKALSGGKYRGKQRGRFVTWASVCAEHGRRLIEKEQV
jgi:hypothetical protein